MPAGSPHFSPKALTFFRQLEKNNDRAWFAPRKGLFEAEVKAPMVELAGWLNDKLRAFAVDHVVDPPAKAVYRIYRDTRFSKDKTPYKAHIGALFPRRGVSRHGGAGYYFGFNHAGVDVAGGMYMPDPAELRAVRQAFAADPEKVAKLLGDKATKRLAGELHGTQSVRLPNGYEAEPGSLLEDLLRRKQAYFDIKLDADLATTPKLGAEVIKRFEVMAPFVDFVNAAILAAKKDEAADDAPKRPVPMF